MDSRPFPAPLPHGNPVPFPPRPESRLRTKKKPSESDPLHLQRVLVTLNRENEALVVAEKARTRAFLDMESGRGHYHGGGQANIEIKSEGDIVSLVNRQKASVLYYSMAAGYLYSWLIVPTKGVVKFHEVCIEEDGEAGTNVVIQV